MAKGRILIVDDDEMDRRLSALDLTDAGYVVAEAENIDEALEHLKATAFDLIILDIVMPGADGLTMLRGLKLSPRLETVPVVMLTASDDIDDELEAMAGGAVSYIVKPAHREVLVVTVNTILEKAKGSHPSQG